MEDYHWPIFTHAMDFFKECASLKKQNLEHFFTSLFVNKGFNNPWEHVINRIFETPKMILCNSK
jgi:hypothetical protein